MRTHQRIFERFGIHLTELAFYFQFGKLLLAVVITDFYAKLGNLKHIQ